MSKKLSAEDFKLVLRKNFGPDCKITKSNIVPLLTAGENFANDLKNVEIYFKRNDIKDEEHINLVLKMFPSSLNSRSVFDYSVFFKKEIFFYEKLLPYYKELEIEYGVKDHDAFDFGPKFYGAKTSSNPDNKDVVDDGVVIFMEDLVKRGYYTMDKVLGLDLDHARLAIKALARFHALGVALKNQKPNLFEIVKKNAVIVPVNVPVKPFQEFLTNELLKDPRMNSKYSNEVQDMLKFINFQGISEPVEPWSTIIHNDMWTKNILFHRNTSGKINDVKFVDFQNYYYSSPLKDLPYFLCTSIEYEVMTEYFDELLDLYYENFIIILKRVHCDTKVFTKDSFYKQLKKDAYEEFVHCIIDIKFFCAEIDAKDFNPDDYDNIVTMNEPNILCRKKWWDVVELYAHRGWI